MEAAFDTLKGQKNKKRRIDGFKAVDDSEFNRDVYMWGSLYGNSIAASDLTIDNAITNTALNTRLESLETTGWLNYPDRAYEALKLFEFPQTYNEDFKIVCLNNSFSSGTVTGHIVGITAA